MDDDYVIQFKRALAQADDASALSMLDNRRITASSMSPTMIYGVPGSFGVLFLAVEHAREKVARALLTLGADIDALSTGGAGFAYTEAGVAIFQANIPALALCHALGAGMSVACRSPVKSAGASCFIDLTAVGLAIRHAQPASLAYLLDTVFPARPIELSEQEMTMLCCSAMFGSRLKALFMVLETRGFNFKILQEIELGEPDSWPPRPMSFAYVLLKTAQKTGDANFTRYIVKRLGIVSTEGRLDASNAFVDASGGLGSSKPEVTLAKFECAACDAVAASKVCTGCRAVRYCSKECSRRHWKSGGHKVECKELQRAAALAATAAASRPEASSSREKLSG